MRGGSVHQRTGIVTRNCETLVWQRINIRAVTALYAVMTKK